MNKFPLPVFEAKQTGRAQGKRKNLLAATDFRSPTSTSNDTHEISGNIRRYQLNIGDLSIAIVRCRAL